MSVKESLHNKTYSSPTGYMIYKYKPSADMISIIHLLKKTQTPHIFFYYSGEYLLKKILDGIRDNLNSGDLNRGYLTCMLDLRNVKGSFNLDITSQRHQNYQQSVMSWIDQWKTEP